MYCLYVSYLCHFYLYYYVLYVTKFWHLIDVNWRQLLLCLNVTITTVFCLHHYVTCTWKAGRRKRLCSKWSCDRYSYFYFLYINIYIQITFLSYVIYQLVWEDKSDRGVNVILYEPYYPVVCLCAIKNNLKNGVA